MKKEYISFGSGIRLLAEDAYAKEMGVTKRAFRKFCRALKVPTLEIGGTKYIEMTSFLLAMRAITRISCPDFLAPGCESLRRAKKDGSLTELDYDKFEKDFEAIVADLVAAKGMNTHKLKKEVKTAAKAVAKRLANAGIQFIPSQAQRERDGRSKKKFQA